MAGKETNSNNPRNRRLSRLVATVASAGFLYVAVAVREAQAAVRLRAPAAPSTDGQPIEPVRGVTPAGKPPSGSDQDRE